MEEIRLQYIPDGVHPVVHVSQNDVGRTFKLLLYDGNAAYSMPAGTTARIDGIKPDGKAFSYTDAVSISGNVATVTTKIQMTLVSGSVVCEIRFDNGGITIGTLNFILQVEPSPLNDDIDISDTEIPAIIELATEQLENAEAWAVGTKNGIPVSSDEPQYENNAKYYSGDSEAWAVGERGGIPVDEDDITYHNNSKYYAEQAKDSADDAEASATDSLSYSRDSEAWAVGERNGVPVGAGDINYQNNSKYYCGLSDATYQLCLDALNEVIGYYAIIRQFLGTLYIVTESGDNIVTESGDKLIIE